MLASQLPGRTGHVLVGAEHDQHAVVVADRIVQIAGQQRLRLEPDAQLHRQRWILDTASHHAGVVVLGGHRALDVAIPADHSCGDLTLQAKPPHRFLTRRIQRRGDAVAAIRRIDADVGAIQPVARWLVRRQPAALDDVGKRVIEVLEVERQSQRGGRRDHTIAVEGDELTVRKQLDVFQVVLRLESLGIVQCWKARTLQHRELFSVLGSGLHDDVGGVETAVVPHGEGFRLCIGTM
jgi:hypothetical protein